MLIPLQRLVRSYGMKIHGVLHVGAHECEERNDYHAVGVSDDCIFWVEGNVDLVAKMKQRDPTIQIYAGLVSDKDGTPVQFIITNNFQSSSILELDKHKTEHPHIVETERRQAVTIRLDTLIKETIGADVFAAKKVNFLNLDIQGAELLALQGMGSTLDQMDYVYSEVNTQHLYRNCALMQDLDKFLSARGFCLREADITEHGWGDAIWIRRSILTR